MCRPLSLAPRLVCHGFSYVDTLGSFLSPKSCLSTLRRCCFRVFEANVVPVLIVNMNFKKILVEVMSRVKHVQERQFGIIQHGVPSQRSFQRLSGSCSHPVVSFAPVIKPLPWTIAPCPSAHSQYDEQYSMPLLMLAVFDTVNTRASLCRLHLFAYFFCLLPFPSPSCGKISITLPVALIEALFGTGFGQFSLHQIR